MHAKNKMGVQEILQLAEVHNKTEMLNWSFSINMPVPKLLGNMTVKDVKLRMDAKDLTKPYDIILPWIASLTEKEWEKMKLYIKMGK